MMLREHVIEVDLFTVKQTYENLAKILSVKLKKDKLEGEPKLIWCINNDATRAVVLRIGKDQYNIFTSVANQAIKQDWEWIDARFDHDRLFFLAQSDVRITMQRLLAEIKT